MTLRAYSDDYEVNPYFTLKDTLRTAIYRQLFIVDFPKQWYLKLEYYQQSFLLHTNYN